MFAPVTIEKFSSDKHASSITDAKNMDNTLFMYIRGKFQIVYKWINKYKNWCQ